MSLQLLLGPAGSGKTYAIYQECISKSIEYPDKNYIILVPEQATLQTQQELLRLHPRHGSLNIDVIGFTTLAYRVIEELRIPLLKMIDDAGRMMLLRRAIERVRPKLTVIGCEVHKTDYAEKIMHTLGELITYRQLEDESALRILLAREDSPNRYTFLKRKLQDILYIWEAYQEELRDRFMDKDELLPLLCKYMEDSDFLRVSEVFVDDFHGFTPIQYEILEGLLRICPRVTIALCYEQSEEETEDPFHLFHSSDQIAERLKHLAAQHKIEICKDHYLDSPVPYRFLRHKALAHLQKNFGRNHTELFCHDCEDIVIFQRENPVDEWKRVLEEVNYLVQECHYRYSDIVIVSDCIERYTEIAKRLFTNTSIPYFIDAPRSLLNNHYVKFVLSLFRLAAHNFKQEDLIYCMKFGFLLAREDADLLENHALRYNLNGFLRWSTGLESEETDPKSLSGEQRRKELMQLLTPFYQEVMHGKHKVSVYLAALYKLFDNLAIDAQLQQIAEYLTDIGMYDKAQEYGMVYDKMNALLEQCALLLGDEEVSTEDLLEILESGAGHLHIGVIPPTLDRLIVGDLHRTRIANVKAVFIIGANEGSFPALHDKQGILSNGDRELLQKEKIELSLTLEQESLEDRLTIYNILTKPSERLYIAYPNMDAEGKPAVASAVLREIGELFAGSLVRAYTSEEGVRLLSPSYALENIQRLPALGEERFCSILGGLLQLPKMDQLLERMMQASEYAYKQEQLADELAWALYGDQNMLSASRLESYSACEYMYFLKYGLQLEHRERYEVDARERGIFFHGVMQYLLQEFGRPTSKYLPEVQAIFDRIKASGGKMTADLFYRLEEKNQPLAAAAMEFAASRINGLRKKMESMEYYQYLWDFWKQEVLYLCRMMEFQHCQGAFTEYYSEQRFGDAGFLDTDEGNEFFDNALLLPGTDCRLSGVVDRLDTAYVSESGEYYFRIFDYKSSNKQMDLGLMMEGLQLQLPLYLYAVSKRFQSLGRSATPVGMYYYPAKEQIVTLDEDISKATDDADTLIAKFWEKMCSESKWSGISNSSMKAWDMQEEGYSSKQGYSRLVSSVKCSSDLFTDTSRVLSSEEMAELFDYVLKKAAMLHKNMVCGKIRKSPYRKDKASACEYCEYRGICHFDPNIRGYSYRDSADISMQELRDQLKQAKKGGEEDGISVE